MVLWIYESHQNNGTHECEKFELGVENNHVVQCADFIPPPRGRSDAEQPLRNRRSGIERDVNSELGDGGGGLVGFWKPCRKRTVNALLGEIGRRVLPHHKQ